MSLRRRRTRRSRQGIILRTSPFFTPMKPWIAPLLVVFTASACASGPSHEDQRLALYRAHAGAPVRSFSYLGRFDRWEALGDTAVAVWTRPHDGWLLDLGTPCLNLDYA